MSQRPPRAGRPTTLAFVRSILALEPWRTAAAIVLLASLGLVTGFSLLLLVPLLQLVGLDVGAGALDRIAVWFSRGFALVGVRPTLVSVLVAYVCAVAASGGLTRLQTVLNQTLSYNLVTRCQQRLYAAIGRANWVFFSRAKASDYTHALVTECDRIGAGAFYLINFAGTAIVSAVYVAVALRVSWLLTMLVFACGAALLLPLRQYRERSSRLGERSSEVQQRLYGSIADFLSGMKTLRSFGAAERHIDQFGRLSDEVRAVSKGSGRHFANTRYAFELGTVIMLAAIVYYAVAVRHIPAAEVLLLLFLFARIMPQVSSLEQTYLSFTEHLPSFAAVQDLERRCLEAAEPRGGADLPLALHHAIELRDVSFAYGAAPVVRGVSFGVRAGKTTGLVGPSGAGKSTIADLVIGLMAPGAGAVLVDGTPLSPSVMKAWRDQIGYVAQDGLLFHDTVRANLQWVRPSATADDLWDALELAAAADFVRRLPQGLDTVVGDRGVLLSGGERQRLALARALVRKPALLLLDEATSALDFESERRILDAIDRLHGRMTILIITHRLSTVRHADVIHVVDNGRLVESGTWDELVNAPGGRFLALYTASGSMDGRPGVREPLPAIS